MRQVSIATLLVITLSACTDTTSQPRFDGPAFGKGSGGGGTTNAAASFHLLPTTAGGSNLAAGDALYPSQYGYQYQDGKCGVTANVLYSGSSDFISSTDRQTAGDRKCVAYGSSAVPRKIRLDYGDVNGDGISDGIVETLPGGINVLQIGTLQSGSGYRQVGIHLTGSTRCARLQFDPASAAEQLTVTRVGSGVWHITGSDRSARCLDASANVIGRSAGLTIDFVVTTP